MNWGAIDVGCCGGGAPCPPFSGKDCCCCCCVKVMAACVRRSCPASVWCVVFDVREREFDFVVVFCQEKVDWLKGNTELSLWSTPFLVDWVC